MTNFSIQWWVWFNIILFALLAIDLAYLPKRTKKYTYVLPVICVTLAMLFTAGLYFAKGSAVSLEFATGYLLELSLSVDNLFVFIMLFHHFHVPERWKNKILTYGIIGALVMRFLFIVIGITLINMFHWILLLFGAFLIVTGIMMFKKANKDVLPKESFIVKYVKKLFRFKDTWEQDTFFIKSNGKLFATPAFLTLCAIESTDLVFALDSIPAVFAITLDPFIVYSANALAIVGLRSLFFVLKDGLLLFKNLHYGISVILVYVGCKMVIAPWYAIDTLTSLGVIASILLISLIIPTSSKKVP